MKNKNSSLTITLLRDMKINVIRASSELAHQATMDELLIDEGVDESLMYNTEFPEQYTKEAQIIFNKWYDYFFESLVRCQIQQKSPKLKKVKIGQMENWLGSDQCNIDNMLNILTEIANGEYTAENLRNDVVNYNS